MSKETVGTLFALLVAETNALDIQIDIQANIPLRFGVFRYVYQGVQIEYQPQGVSLGISRETRFGFEDFVG